jgi:hypothetical protein
MINIGFTAMKRYRERWLLIIGGPILLDARMSQKPMQKDENTMEFLV